MFNIDSKINVYSKKRVCFNWTKPFFFFFFFWGGGGGRENEGGGVLGGGGEEVKGGMVDLQWTNHRNWSKLLG